VAAGGVGQDGEAVGRQEVEQVLLARVGDVHAAHGDGHDLGARGLDHLARLREPPGLARADQETATVHTARQHEAIVHLLHPPPTKWMISTASPSRSAVRAYSARGTTARFTSSAMRRGPRPSAATRSATVAPASSARGSPFTMTCTTRRDDSPRGGGRQPTAPALASTAASAIGNEEPPVHIHGRPTVAEVSLGALRHNCRRVRELVGPGVAVLAVVKADAYGHGAVPAARAFLAAGAVDTAAGRAQVARFVGALEALAAAGIRPRHVHLANSAGVLAAPGAHFTMVRPGIMLYGYAPASHLAERAAVRHAMRLSTAITQTRRVPAGTPVSYAGTFVT